MGIEKKWEEVEECFSSTSVEIRATESPALKRKEKERMYERNSNETGKI